jgi:hypothetical protein
VREEGLADDEESRRKGSIGIVMNAAIPLCDAPRKGIRGAKNASRKGIRDTKNVLCASLLGMTEKK